MRFGLGFDLGITRRPVTTHYGPELVQNGGFDTDLAGWLRQGTGALTWTPQGAEYVAASIGGPYQVIPTETGKTYRVSVRLVSAAAYTAGTGLYIGNGTAPGTGATIINNNGGPGLLVGTYTATGVSSYIYGRGVANSDAVWDDFSFRAVLP